MPLWKFYRFAHILHVTKVEVQQALKRHFSDNFNQSVATLFALLKTSMCDFIWNGWFETLKALHAL